MKASDELRRFILYECLVANGDRFVYQEELYDAVSPLYPPLDGRKFHDSTARVMMSEDISVINRSPEYDKIIISTRRGVKIANKEEARQMISARHAAALREMQDIAILTKKFDRDGQKGADGKTRETTI